MCSLPVEEKSKGRCMNIYRIMINVFTITLMLVSIMACQKPGKKGDEAKDKQEELFQVKTRTFEVGTFTSTVKATGIVQAVNNVKIHAEVVGRVTFTSPKLVAGTQVKKGQLLLRIDSREYQLAVDQRKSQVENAKLELEKEKVRGSLAEKEWKLLKGSEEASDLVLRKQNLAAAEAVLKSAQSALKQAELNLYRTSIRAPFDGIIVSEAVNVGQVVNSQVQLLHLVGDDVIHVEANVPLSSINRLNIKGVNADHASEAVLVQDLGDGFQIVRDGFVKGLLGELDQQTRRARVLIEASNEGKEGIPMLSGAFVTIEVVGSDVSDIFKIPMKYISDGSLTWVVDTESKLQQLNLDVLWTTDQFVFARYKGRDILRVVRNLPQAPLNGLKVKAIEEK